MPVVVTEPPLIAIVPAPVPLESVSRLAAYTAPPKVVAPELFRTTSPKYAPLVPTAANVISPLPVDTVNALPEPVIAAPNVTALFVVVNVVSAPKVTAPV